MEKIFGRNPVLEALQTNASLEKVYIQDSIHGAFEKEIRQRCRDRNIPLGRLPKVKIDREIRGNHQGVFALGALVQYVALEDLVPKLFEDVGDPLLVVLDGITDVRNMGSIARTSEVFGAHALVMSSRNSAPINEIAMKTSSGALNHLLVSRVDKMQQAMHYLRSTGFTLYASSPMGSKDAADLDIQRPLALLVGAEGRGLPRETSSLAHHLIKIRQKGNIESLNVAVATGILLHELTK